MIETDTLFTSKTNMINFNLDLPTTLNIDLPTDQIIALQKLIGIDLNVAIKIFADKGNIVTKNRGFNKKVGGFAEELVALILDEKRPTSLKGRDFNNFELKSIKAKYVNSDRTNVGSLLRDGGNTPISPFKKNEVDFTTSNIYDKVKKLVCVYHIDEIITDIRFFDGEELFETLRNDYNLIAESKRTETELLTLKEKNGMIMIKKYGTIRHSVSLAININNEMNPIWGHNFFKKTK